MRLLTTPIGILFSIISFGFMILLFQSILNKPKIGILGIIYVPILGTMIAEIIQNPVESYTNRTFGNITEISQRSMVVREATTLVLFFFCFLIIFFRILQSKNLFVFERNSFVLFFGILMFSFGIIFAEFFSTHPEFNDANFRFPIVGLAVLLALPINHKWALKHILYSLLIIIYASLISIIIDPNWAMMPYGASVIPGLNFRLFGVTSHPNALGYYASFSSLIIVYQLRKPNKQKIFLIISYICTILVLILAQSKTAWVSTAAAYSVIIIYDAFKAKLKGKSGIRLILMMCVFVGITSIIVLNSNKLIKNEMLMTFSGRTYVWSTAFEIFKKYPIFGYGPTLWSIESRQNIFDGRLWAGQAHNQFLDTISTNGIIGLLSISIYLIIFFLKANKLLRITGGISLALFVNLLFRSLMESPISPGLSDYSQLFIYIFFLSLFVHTSSSKLQNKNELALSGKKLLIKSPSLE